ncbi:uncharacterized protein LOC134340985 [Mobula hypostoma]|uniref:uncharacterized protein LOC134340985 n=1 Tax=Mobula hypostoma TaxID=723540 RepID=UPI002FC2A766
MGRVGFFSFPLPLLHTGGYIEFKLPKQNTGGRAAPSETPTDRNPPARSQQFNAAPQHSAYPSRDSPMTVFRRISSTNRRKIKGDLCCQLAASRLLRGWERNQRENLEIAEFPLSHPLLSFRCLPFSHAPPPSFFLTLHSLLVPPFLPFVFLALSLTVGTDSANTVSNGSRSEDGLGIQLAASGYPSRMKIRSENHSDESDDQSVPVYPKNVGQDSFEDLDLELHASFGSLREWDLFSGFHKWPLFDMPNLA